MNPDQDPVIARALADLSVPDHGPGFWEGLERRLAGDVPGSVDTVDQRDESGPGDPDEVAEADEADTRTSTGELPSVADLYVGESTPRRPRIWFAAAAAVVILAVISAAFVLAGGGDDDDPEVATPAEDSTETTAAVSTTSSGGGSTTTEDTTPGSSPPGSESAPGPVVVDWLEAVASGDVETAAALTGPRSVAHVESLGEDASIEGLIEESAEGYGGMSAAPDREVQELRLGSFDFGEVTLVLVTGTSAGEGADGNRHTLVFPVVTADGASVVEPWAYGPEGSRLEVTQPEAGSLAAEEAIELFAPVDGTVFFRLDDGIEGLRPVETSTVAGAPFARYDPPGSLDGGDHIVILGFVAPDGEVLLGDVVEFTAA